MSDLLWNPGSWRRHFLHFLKCVAAFFSEQSNSRGFTFSVASLRERNTYLLCAHFLLKMLLTNKNVKIRRATLRQMRLVSCRAELKTTTTNERETVCQTNFPGLDMATSIQASIMGMWQHAFSDPWAPPGHHRGTNMPVFCVCHQYCCRRWQTCEGLGAREASCQN